MIAFPWYLLSAGILIVIVGFLLAGLRKPPRSKRRGIDPAMRDHEILRELRREQRISLPNLVVFLGLLCILISVVWRLILRFV